MSKTRKGGVELKDYIESAMLCGGIVAAWMHDRASSGESLGDKHPQDVFTHMAAGLGMVRLNKGDDEFLRILEHEQDTLHHFLETGLAQMGTGHCWTWPGEECGCAH